MIIFCLVMALNCCGQCAEKSGISTEFSDRGSLTSPSSVAQTIPEYSSQFEFPHWFSFPDDIRLCVVWRSSSPESQGASRWLWRKILGPKEIASGAVEFPAGTYGLGIGSPILSPDATRALFPRQKLDFDYCHDALIVDLVNGRSQLWHDYLFGTSERWSPDGKRIAFVAGSMDTILGDYVDPPLRLSVGGVPSIDSVSASPASLIVHEQKNAITAESVLRTDEHLDRNSVTWTQSGDLLAGTDWLTRPNNNDPREELTHTPLILRFKGGAGKGIVWQLRAITPVPSLDGKRIAFWGYESADPNCTKPMVCVADDSGRDRHTFGPLPAGSTRAFFSPDNRHILLFNLQSDYKSPDYVSPANYKAPPQDFSPINMTISLVEYDVISGEQRAITDLRGIYRPWATQIGPQFYDVSPLGLSKDGRYFFFRRIEMRRFRKGIGKPVAVALHAIRISDGKLIPVAVFPNDFAIQPL